MYESSLARRLQSTRLSFSSVSCLKACFGAACTESTSSRHNNRSISSFHEIDPSRGISSPVTRQFALLVRKQPSDGKTEMQTRAICTAVRYSTTMPNFQILPTAQYRKMQQHSRLLIRLSANWTEMTDGSTSMSNFPPLNRVDWSERMIDVPGARAIRPTAQWQAGSPAGWQWRLAVRVYSGGAGQSSSRGTDYGLPRRPQTCGTVTCGIRSNPASFRGGRSSHSVSRLLLSS